MGYYPCERCNMDDGSPVCLMDERCTSRPLRQQMDRRADAGKSMLPCPWCRADGDSLFDLWSRFDAGTIAHVHCTRCGADGPSVYSEASADDAIRQARKRWNARPSQVSMTHNAKLCGPGREEVR